MSQTTSTPKEMALIAGGTVGGAVLAGLVSYGMFYWHHRSEQQRIREETSRMCHNKFSVNKLQILWNLRHLETVKFTVPELHGMYARFRSLLQNPQHGVLTFADFKKILDDIKGEGAAYDDKLALSVFSIWDLDRSGSIDFVELVEGLSVICHSPQIQILARFFTAFDDDCNGTLNRQEVTNLIRAMNPFAEQRQQDELVKAIFASVDKNGDNAISRKEWSQLAFDPSLNFEWTWDFNNELCARFDLVYSKYHTKKDMVQRVNVSGHM